MNNISQNIELIIDELVDPTNDLSSILFKVQLVAIQLDHEKMKDWVEGEVNGYQNPESTPDYRCVSPHLTCCLIKDMGFYGRERIQGYSVPLDILPDFVQELMSNRPVFNSVADLEYTLKNEHSMSFQYPSDLLSIIQTRMEQNIVVETAKLAIEPNSIVAILNQLRSRLLSFFMELKDSNIDLKDYSMKKKNKKLDEVFAKNFGDIHTNNLNISVGDSNSQYSNFGEGTQNNNVYNWEEKTPELSDLMSEIQQVIPKLDMFNEDQEDLTDEIDRVEKQLNRESPKLDIVNTGLKIINNILLGVTTNAYTPIILDKLGKLMG